MAWGEFDEKEYYNVVKKESYQEGYDSGYDSGYNSGQNYGAVATLYSMVSDKVITLDEAIGRSSLSKEEFMNIINQK